MDLVDGLAKIHLVNSPALTNTLLMCLLRPSWILEYASQINKIYNIKLNMKNKNIMRPMVFKEALVV